MYVRRKWKDVYDLPEIVEIRNKIKDAYNDKLQFIEETHQYFLDGVEYTCVSDIIKRWESLDEEALLESCARKAKTKPGYKYYGMTKEEIKAMWEANAKKACDFGTETHAFGESCFYWYAGEDDKILPECMDKFDESGPKPTNKHEQAVVKFWEDLPECFVPVLAETKVFNKTGTPYAGTFDILFYYYCKEHPERSGLLIFDYKTNKALENEFAKSKSNMMRYPFQDCFDEALSHYQIQFSLYQIPIENLGLKVIGRRLIWLLPDGTYEKYKTEDMTGRLRENLKINI